MIKRGKMSSRGVEVLDTTTVIIVTPPCSCHPGPLLCLCCLFFVIEAIFGNCENEKSLLAPLWGQIMWVWAKRCILSNFTPLTDAQQSKFANNNVMPKSVGAVLSECKSIPIPPFPSAQVLNALTRVFRLDGITCFTGHVKKFCQGIYCHVNSQLMMTNEMVPHMWSIHLLIILSNSNDPSKEVPRAPSENVHVWMKASANNLPAWIDSNSGHIQRRNL